MTTPIIVCPHCPTLLLNSPQCPKCGWQRPHTASYAGQIVWSHALQSPIGERLVYPGLWEDKIVFPLEGSRLEAVYTSTDASVWPGPIEFPEGSETRLVVGTQYGFVTTTQNIHSKPQSGLLLYHPGNGRLLWRWNVAAARLSSPAVKDSVAYVYASDQHLYALDLKQREPKWPAPQKMPEDVGWIVDPPLVAEGKIVLPGGFGLDRPARIQCLAGQRPAWHLLEPEGCFISPLACDGVVCLAVGRTELRLLDIQDGKRLLAFHPENRTSPPTCQADVLIVGARVSKGQYGLIAYSMTQGSKKWSYPTGSIVLVPPIIDGNTVLACDETGTIHAINLMTGERLWYSDLHDHIRTRPIAVDGKVILATQGGKVVAIAIKRENEPDLGDADGEDLLSRGDLAGAAANFALHGQYQRAAEVYKSAGAAREAAVLYRKAGDAEMAARVAAAGGWVDLANEIYQSIGKDDEIINIYIRSQRACEAAELLEQRGQLLEAAQQWEAAGKFQRAAICYQAAGCAENAFRTILRTEDAPEKIGMLLQLGHFSEAAEGAERLGYYHQAHLLFSKAKRLEDALRMAELEGDVESIFQHAQELQQHEKAADAARRLGHFKIALKHYRMAAENIENHLDKEDPDKPVLDRVSARAADLYAMALDCLLSGEHDPKYARYLQNKIEKHRRAPRLWAIAKVTDPILVHKHTHTLNIDLGNIGWGPARQVKVKVESDFLGDSEVKEIDLEVGDRMTLNVPIRPNHLEDVGTGVSLDYTIVYRDRNNQRLEIAQRLQVAIGRDINHAKELRLLQRDILGGERMEVNVYGNGPVTGKADNRHDFVEIRREGGINVNGPKLQSSRMISNFCLGCGFPLEKFTDCNCCPRCDKNLQVG